MIEDYRKETIQKIRETSLLINSLTDEQIERLYQLWSSSYASASWLMHDDELIQKFIQYATLSPMERIKNDSL